MSVELNPPEPVTEESKDILAIKFFIEQAIANAELAGYIITVTQQPLQPLAMGNYKSVVDVRKARHPATNTPN